MPLTLATTTTAIRATSVAFTTFLNHRSEPLCFFSPPLPFLSSTSRMSSSQEPLDQQIVPPLSPPPVSTTLSEKELKKQHKKAVKEAKRARREGGKKNLKMCDLCQAEKDLLIRCQIDDSLEWRMVCGKCWKKVSGGVVDGDELHRYYKYGGLWKAR